ncbi:hypothetical protein [Pseudomonas arsenicoxydans]|uniref:Uncharacterized protein n=1 Tax=Pseudomonas arsenicoxydans TaxID=702115 RepID=A0A4P6FZZ7_9PSED|nr:hypothetical protein [Pseudomonas arsenicoxydans]QAY84167.1 hypothetical protein CUN61_09280 [Pseudomonas arsenicoxydans]
MKAKGAMGGGVIACEDAFRRLIDGAPFVPRHIGIEPSKITAGIVSVEAGFDRGYLKKSRKSHQYLLAKIEAFRLEIASDKSNRSTKALEVRQVKEKLSVLENEIQVAHAQRDVVLAQNLQMYERIMELEQEVARIKQ